MLCVCAKDAVSRHGVKSFGSPSGTDFSYAGRYVDKEEGDGALLARSDRSARRAVAYVH